MKKYIFLFDFSKKYPWLPYVAPFIFFLLLTEPARHFPALSPWFYIIKTVVTGLLLWLFQNYYIQDLSGSLSIRQLFEAVVCGIVVFILWISAEGYLFQLNSNSFFDPYALGDTKLALLFWLSIRLLGSSLVVPVMEELFWRSFVMRWLINADFKSVTLGSFSWFSFIATAVLFGLEHERIFAGIAAGILYNLLMIYQKKLKGVILAHAVTNFSLGVYVIWCGQWHFW